MLSDEEALLQYSEEVRKLIDEVYNEKYEEERQVLAVESIVVKSTESNLRKKVRDPWAIIMVLSNILHIEIAMN